MIEFTQYLRPNGRIERVIIDRPIIIEEKAEKLKEMGCYFEIEELTNGTVNMTVEYPCWHKENLEKPFEVKNIKNGNKVPETVDSLISDAWEKRHKLH